jgi:ubiquitin-protein ligase
MFNGDRWTPDDTTISTLMTAQAVLVTPNAASPLNDKAANSYGTNQTEYRRRAQLSV